MSESIQERLRSWRDKHIKVWKTYGPGSVSGTDVDIGHHNKMHSFVNLTVHPLHDDAANVIDGLVASLERAKKNIQNGDLKVGGYVTFHGAQAIEDIDKALSAAKGGSHE
jgi:hypothetical protein